MYYIFGDYMNYIRRNNFGSDMDGVSFSIGMIEHINKLCLIQLTTYKARKESKKKMKLIKSLTPIFIHSSLLLFQTHAVREYDCCFINYFNVLSIIKKGDKTEIVFCDFSNLLVNQKYSKISTQMKNCETVITYINQRKL